MGKKLRILAAADLHGSVDIARFLSDKAKRNKADLVVLAGDINGFRSDEAVLAPFFEARQKVAFVPGNWETEEDQEEFSRGGAKNLHLYYVTYNDVGIAGVGTGDWKFSIEEKEFEAIKKNFVRMKAKKRILVSHVHAAGTGAEFSGFGGDRLLRKAVEEFKPDLLISAHIHEAEGLVDKIGKTKVIQVGRKGKILEI
jgi:Icc-related predicted phosphoesterase